MRTGLIFIGIIDAFGVGCFPFSSYTGDTGGISVNGKADCIGATSVFTFPGWAWAQSIGASFGEAVETSINSYIKINSAGVGNGIQSYMDKFSNQEANGLVVVTNTAGNCWEPSAECATGIQNKVQSGGEATATVATGGGGSGATVITTSGFSNGVGTSRIALDTQTVLTNTVTVTGLISGNGIAVVTLGTAVATPSVCGTLAGGALLSTTAYSITTNVITVTGTNPYYAGETVTLSGYATSTFLNGQTVTVKTSSGTAFTAIFTHANASATEAGLVNSVNVDTPRAANNGTTTMTVMINLPSTYAGAAGDFITIAGFGNIETNKLASVGGYSGGVQTVTVPLHGPFTNISAGTIACMGGSLQGYFAKNNSVSGDWYNYVLGTPTTGTAYITALRGSLISYVESGTMTFAPGGIIEAVNGNQMTIAPNPALWADGDAVLVPEGITSRMTYQNNGVINDNPFMGFGGALWTYDGADLFYGGDFNQVFSVTPSQLIAHGGTGYAPNLFTVKGDVGIVMNLRNPPEGAFGLNSGIINVGCELTPCNTLYNLFSFGDTSGDAISYNSTTDVVNFLNRSFGTMTIQQNGNAVCDTSGATCPTVTLKHLAGTSASAPTVVAGVGAGTSPTIALVSATDLSGYITLTTGTSPTASSPVATVTFNSSYTSTPKCFAWPSSPATQALVGAAQAQIFRANTTTGVFVLTQGSIALPASAAFEWGYTCTQ